MTAPERFAEKSDSLLHRGRRPYMTHNVNSPSSIAALRKVYSITSSALLRSADAIVTPSEAVPVEKGGDGFKLRWRDGVNKSPCTRARLELALICPGAA